MAVAIRLARAGGKKKPVFNIVVTDTTQPRDGEFLQHLGQYRPKAAEFKDKVTVDAESVKKWISKGARMTQTVGQLLKNLAK